MKNKWTVSFTRKMEC